ncbi:hypothetical protein JFU03_23345 [Bacillus sp. TH44]|uniref:hypothetical protein n=1 Tax=unclassified Bacillus (in: firmicutes) TaxID=185979 RepID=UPI001913F693|nr:hypothetical protein [Bacillus sp. TH45]MBK5360754.1 hypothetical protein [Bacillus sp. TH44]MBK5362444.1 hypothetical protein [Bacillus sp. TH50]
MKKMILSLFILGMINLSGCTFSNNEYGNFRVLEKSRYNEGGYSPSHLYEKAQEDPTMIHYSNDSISEGKRMVYLALGEKYKNEKITVKEVKDEKAFHIYITTNNRE